MKSLMEEASSISKAIEKGWTNAGKPKEFTIKIYEESEKNFIGMTTKPAKIGIFFTEPKQPAPDTRRTKQRNPVAQAPRTAERAPKEPRKEPRPQEERAPRKQEDLGPIWDDSMVQSTKAWLTEMLTHMHLGHSSFTIEPDRFHLKINFKQNLLDDRDRQKHLFAVFSGLLLSMLKRQCKRPLRGYKIVLTQE